MRARSLWRFGACCAAALPLTSTTWSAASPSVGLAETRAEAQRDTLDVEVEFAGVQRSSELAAKAAAWFAGSGLAFSSRERDTIDAEQWLRRAVSGIRVLVSGVEATRLRLWFVQESGGVRKYLLREVTLPNGLDEIALENVAQLLFSSALALAEGREETPAEQVAKEMRQSRPAAASRAPLPKSAGSGGSRRAVEQPTRSNSRPSAALQPGLRLTAAAGYELRFSGPEGIYQGPLLSLGVRRPAAGWEPAFGTSVTLLVPGSFEQDDYRVDLKGYSGRLQALLRRSQTKRFALTLALGVGVDLLSLSPHSRSSSSFFPSAEQRALRPFAELGGGAGIRLGALTLSSRLGVIAHFSRIHYDVEEAGVRRESFSAWPLQPVLRVELGW